MMIMVKDKRKDMYLEFLQNIDKYDIIYIGSEDKANGSIYRLDSYPLFYINSNKVQFEIVLDLLNNNVVSGEIKNIALLHAEHLRIKDINTFQSIPGIEIDIYAQKYDEFTNMYSTSRYLYNKMVKMRESK